MAVQISIYNLLSKQKDVRFIFDEDRIIRIHGAQVMLEKEISCKANEIVLTEIV